MWQLGKDNTTIVVMYGGDGFAFSNKYELCIVNCELFTTFASEYVIKRYEHYA